MGLASLLHVMHSTFENEATLASIRIGVDNARVRGRSRKWSFVLDRPECDAWKNTVTCIDTYSDKDYDDMHRIVDGAVAW